ncbi:hypothetical protein [Mycoplasma testudineum]|uniref:hypothetical protein n=1 Tax=Mycoplasma testudineum TaxID=244584 RepID=UPI000B9F6450|nr:hypothetical protein [Mycoplasma testudineum]OYD26806.1 hypothetical protein CG473_01705 [Mycoplasma testudineum]
MFKIQDVETKIFLKLNNDKFDDILNEQLIKIKKYKFEDQINLKNIVSDRRIKFQLNYFKKRLKLTDGKISKFSIVREAVTNNIQWSHTYADPTNYTKYFEYLIYVEAGFIEI